MTPTGSATEVTLGFMPESLAIADPDHPGLRRAGPRTAAPYAKESVELHRCRATDLSLDDGARPDLLAWGFDMVDLSGLDTLQDVLARVRVAGRITEDDAATIRSALAGQTLSGSGGATLEVLHIADEGLIMRSSGPNGVSVTFRSDVPGEHGPRKPLSGTAVGIVASRGRTIVARATGGLIDRTSDCPL